MEEPANLDLQVILDRLQNRREFLQLFGKGLGYSALGALLPACGGGSNATATPAIQIPANPIPKASAEYTLLKRTSFGPRQDALQSIKTLGIDAYLEVQLDHESIDDGTLEAEIGTLFPLTAQTPAQLLAGFPDNIAETARQMVGATQYRQMFSQRQLYEIMVEFWSDHFNIHLLNGLGPTLKPTDDREVIRANALGNFSVLLHASAKSPAMLFYLDNFFNQEIAPNENYARELMELHTLGVDGGYTEDDVKEVARCFTGWTLNFPDDVNYGEFVYADVIHDKASKLVLGNPIAANGAQDDAEQVLDLLAGHASTASFIATKLCRRFISDSPDAATVTAVATAFSSSAGDIKTTLRALFASPAFRNTSDLKLSRPSEFLPALVRALAPAGGYPSDDGQFFFVAQSILGQLPFYWPTPDGYPDKQSYWAGTGGLLNRWRLSFLSYSGIIPGIDVLVIDYSSMLSGAETVTTIVDALTDTILMRPLSAEHRDIIIDWLMTEFGVGADDVLPPGSPAQVSPLIAAVLISSAYFQLR